MRKLLALCMGGFILGWFILTGALAADVDVYAEGTYTKTELVVYIYADIKKSTKLKSGGVRLFFDPAQLGVISAEKNEEVWCFSDGFKKTPYADPDFKTTPGEVVFILGKMDAKDRMAGVTGKRVLLGRAVFGPIAGMPMPEEPASYIKALTYGRGDGFGSYDNFVTVQGRVLDKTNGVAFKAVAIHKRGDADGNGQVDAEDIKRMEKNIEKGDNPIWYDCNGDGRIDTYDIKCLRQKLPE